MPEIHVVISQMGWTEHVVSTCAMRYNRHHALVNDGDSHALLPSPPLPNHHYPPASSANTPSSGRAPNTNAGLQPSLECHPLANSHPSTHKVTFMRCADTPHPRIPSSNAAPNYICMITFRTEMSLEQEEHSTHACTMPSSKPSQLYALGVLPFISGGKNTVSLPSMTQTRENTCGKCHTFSKRE